MYEPCIISGKRGVKSLLNQPDVPAAASGIAEGSSHLRPQLGAGARGIWRDKSLLLRSDWQVPHGWRQSRHNAQVGSSVWWDQTPANWLFSGSSLQLGVSSVKICICLSMWFYKTKLITFTLELEGSQSLVGGGYPAEFAEAGLSVCCQSLNNLEQNSHDCSKGAESTDRCLFLLSTISPKWLWYIKVEPVLGCLSPASLWQNDPKIL